MTFSNTFVAALGLFVFLANSASFVSAQPPLCQGSNPFTQLVLANQLIGRIYTFGAGRDIRIEDIEPDDNWDFNDCRVSFTADVDVGTNNILWLSRGDRTGTARITATTTEFTTVDNTICWSFNVNGLSLGGTTRGTERRWRRRWNRNFDPICI